MAFKKSDKYFLILLIIFVITLTACNPTPTPQPTIYNPGCNVSNLINNLNSLNANSGPSEINLDPGCVYTITQSNNTAAVGPLSVNNGLPPISSSVKINGNNAVIDVQVATVGHFFIEPGGDLVLYDLTLSNGSRPVGGAVINLQGDFFASHTTFLNNVAYPDGDLVARGGAVYNDSGDVRIIANSLLQENHAGENLFAGSNLGGAIYSLNGSLTVTKSTLIDNFSSGHGGAIYSTKNSSDESFGAVIINEGEFSGNYADGNGGALLLANERDGVFIIHSEFSDNQATDSGGAVFSGASHIEGAGNDFKNNSAIFGGAVYTKRTIEGQDSVYDSYLSSFSENIASEVGGAIFSENSDLSIEDVLMEFNVANSCGAISTGGDPSIDIIAGDLETAPHIVSNTQITDSQFSRNEATQSHGGAVCHVMGNLSVQNTAFDLNSAVSMGGGLLLLDDNELSGLRLDSNSAELGGGIALGAPGNNLTFITSISGSTFNSNQSILRGGGIWSDQFGATNISKSTFSGNTTKFGGGIYSGRGDLYITNSTFSGNIAWRGGGIKHRDIVSAPDLVIKHTTFALNIATEQDDGGISWNYEWGGGALNIGGKASVINSLFFDNLPMNCQLKNGMNYSESGSYASDHTCGGTEETSPMIIGLMYAGYPTAVHGLMPGSPLIDVLSNCAVLTDDQRGTARPTGAGCEPGSYEFDATDPPAPPPMPPMPETSNCDPFAGMEVSLLTLGLPEDTMQLPVVLRVDGMRILSISLIPDMRSGERSSQRILIFI